MTFEEAKQQAIDRSEWVLCHGAGYYTARTPGGISADCGSGTQGDRISRGVFWRGSLRSRIRILPPRDPPGDGGRREGGGQVFTGTQLHTL